MRLNNSTLKFCFHQKHVNPGATQSHRSRLKCEPFLISISTELFSPTSCQACTRIQSTEAPHPPSSHHFDICLTHPSLTLDPLHIGGRDLHTCNFPQFNTYFALPVSSMPFFCFLLLSLSVELTTALKSMQFVKRHPEYQLINLHKDDFKQISTHNNLRLWDRLGEYGWGVEGWGGDMRRIQLQVLHIIGNLTFQYIIIL